MTEPAPDAPAERARQAPDAVDPGAIAPGRAPGLFQPSIEGRHAPGLFVAGWLATLVGAGLAVEVELGGGSGGAAGILLFVALGLLSVGLILLGGSQAIDRRAANEPYAGPSPILLFLAIVAVTLFVAFIVGTALDILGVSVDRPVGDLVSVAIQALVFVGMVRLMVVGPRATTWSEMGLTREPRTIAIAAGTGALLALPVILITGAVASVLVPLVGQAPPSPLPPTGTASGLGLHLIAGAGIGPFAEEIVFRGAALTAWLKGIGPRGAIVRSALLFAAAHALGIGGTSFGQAFGLAVVASLARFPVAVALGWIYVRTGTLWASIGLHAAFNAILIVVSESSLAAPAALLLG